MQAEHYFGTYARFDTKSKKDASVLLGADNLVGDRFDIVFEKQDGVSVAWMRNKFGAMIGFFNPEFSRELSVLAARGWNLQALLSFVAYTDTPEPGHYWGQAAVICCEPTLEHAVDIFMDGVSKRLSDSIRPEVGLGEQGVEQLLEHEGDWQPKKTVPLPERKTGTVIMKNRRKMSEKLIEQGRKGNKGCYAVSWIFLLLVVAVAIFGLKSCGVL